MKNTYLKLSIIAFSLVALISVMGFNFSENKVENQSEKENFYDFTFKAPMGETVKMSDYKGKTILIVNTATECGLTPQFKGLEKLHNKYKEKGLVILGFPCNQFGGQAPESNEEVEEVCRLNHGVTFQLSERIDVNGDNAHPVYVYLKKELRGALGRDIKWNFTKFLISPEGKAIKRFSPKAKPAKMEDDIIGLLNL